MNRGIRYLLLAASVSVAYAGYLGYLHKKAQDEVRRTHDFFAMCRAFKSDHLPPGTTVLTSQAFRREPTGNDGDEGFFRYVVVYRYSGSKTQFARAMTRRVERMSFPEATYVSEYFSDDPPSDDGYSVFLAAQTGKDWSAIQQAVAKPKTCLLALELPDDEELEDYRRYKDLLNSGQNPIPPEDVRGGRY
jgi:hypothetical protein